MVTVIQKINVPKKEKPTVEMLKEKFYSPTVINNRDFHLQQRMRVCKLKFIYDIYGSTTEYLLNDKQERM